MKQTPFSKLIAARGWLLLWLLIFASTFCWRAQNLNGFGLTNDEGAYLMWSQLPLEGYPLYTETRAVQPPLFFEWVGLFLRLLGPIPAAGRWSTLVAYTLLAVTLSWLGHRAKGRVAALGVVLLLGVAPLTFTFSRLVMAEIPAIALAVLSLVWLFVYLDRTHRGWLFGSGLALGLSLLIKALNPFVALLVGVLLWWQARDQTKVRSSLRSQRVETGFFKGPATLSRKVDQVALETSQAEQKPGFSKRMWSTFILNGLWWGAGLLLPLILTALLYDTPAMIDQTIAFRGDLRAAIPGSWEETWSHFSLLLTTHWGLWLLAGGGMISAVMSLWLPLNPPKIKEGASASPSLGNAGKVRGYSPSILSNPRNEGVSKGAAPAMSEGQPAPFDTPWKKLKATQDANLTLLPPLGGLSVTIQPGFYTLLWSLWLVSAIVLLAWHTPLFYHHLIILLPPLILLAAGFMADVVTLFGSLVTKLQFRNQTSKNIGTPLPKGDPLSEGERLPEGQRLYQVEGLGGRAIPLALVLILLLAAAFNLPAMFTANQKAVDIVTGGRETEAMAFLQAVTLPTDFVMGDSQLFIYMADRRTPPPLGDVALVAVKAGRQTSPRMIELSQTYQAAAVAQWSLRLPWLPDYLAWVEANYLARKVWDNDHIIHFAPRFPDNQPLPNEQAIILGEPLTLRGYAVDEVITDTAQGLNLQVYWQTSAPLNQDYTVFTQLLDQQGQLVAGWDSQPLGGKFPTSHWPAAEIVTDRVHLTLPEDLPAGEYRLITGMYLLDTLERLATPDGQDHINLTTVTVID